MADRIINRDIVFAYATDSAVADLKPHLEKYFLYQNIAIFDPNFEYGLQSQGGGGGIRCNFVVCHSLKEFFLIQNVVWKYHFKIFLIFLFSSFG